MTAHQQRAAQVCGSYPQFLRFKYEWDKARYTIIGWPEGVDEEALWNEYLREVSESATGTKSSKG